MASFVGNEVNLFVTTIEHLPFHHIYNPLMKLILKNIQVKQMVPVNNGIEKASEETNISTYVQTPPNFDRRRRDIRIRYSHER